MVDRRLRIIFLDGHWQSCLCIAVIALSGLLLHRGRIAGREFLQLDQPALLGIPIVNFHGKRLGQFVHIRAVAVPIVTRECFARCFDTEALVVLRHSR
jgi:hypothetical protein